MFHTFPLFGICRTLRYSSILRTDRYRHIRQAKTDENGLKKNPSPSDGNDEVNEAEEEEVHHISK